MLDWVYPLFRSLQGMNLISVAFRIALSVLIGGCIGSERGRHGRAAGLRTHILVCLGSALTAMVGLYTASVLGFQNDPMRVSAQVISGIGFLGAGTIMTRHHLQVTGLTTAAGLWATASIGIAVGIGFYSAAFMAFFVMILTATLFPRLEREQKERITKNYYIELSSAEAINDFSDSVSDVAAEFRVVAARSAMREHIGVELTVSNSNLQSGTILQALRSQVNVIFAVLVSEHT